MRQTGLVYGFGARDDFVSLVSLFVNAESIAAQFKDLVDLKRIEALVEENLVKKSKTFTFSKSRETTSEARTSTLLVPSGD